MLEYGSDFHYCSDLENQVKTYLYEQHRYYANGRHAISHLILYRRWKRIWMPDYFCYDVIKAIKDTRIEVVYYKDNPLDIEVDKIVDLPFQSGDVLLRMNYFGLRGFMDNENFPVEVIEDHSHDLIGNWANTSNADWCIASLRKSIPLPEGGILWSPKGKQMPPVLDSSLENDLLSCKRLNAMLLKKLYMDGCEINKSSFRNLFIQTEESFTKLNICGMASDSFDLYKDFSISEWYYKKKSNWEFFVKQGSKKYSVLIPEDVAQSNPFSVILFFESKIIREEVRRRLLEHDIYPAILWNIPAGHNETTIDISERLLSIHCDGRYNHEDMLHTWEIINE